MESIIFQNTRKSNQDGAVTGEAVSDYPVVAVQGTCHEIQCPVVLDVGQVDLFQGYVFLLGELKFFSRSIEDVEISLGVLDHQIRCGKIGNDVRVPWREPLR